jgi:drug/metabolite transporter (DMT)-like permease
MLRWNMGAGSQFKAWTALVAVYVFWGATYLGIRIALEAFPPLLLISIRYLLSGAIMLVGAKLLHAPVPSGREFWLTALYGILVLGGGNGCLTYAELYVPSGTAALLLTTSPFWMVGLEAAIARKRLYLPTLIGIFVGFLGVLILIAPSAIAEPVGTNLIIGFLILQLGCFCWCFGALMQRRQPTRARIRWSAVPFSSSQREWLS